jgi:hypothetical protein
MLATPIRVDARVETDVGTVVSGDDRTRIVPQEDGLAATIRRLQLPRLQLDLRDAQAEPRFCGSRLVVQSVSRQSQQLLVYDDLAGAPRVPFNVARNSRDLEIQLACDADTAVLVDRQAPRRTAIEVVPLAS